MRKISDILLLPKWFYARLTGKKATLFAGFIFVGIIDVLFPFGQSIQEFFVNKAPADRLFNIAIAAGLIVILGALDVFFFARPLLDLFKRFKPEPSVLQPGLLTRVMKVYIAAHVLILPVNTVVFYADSRLGQNSSMILMLLVIFYISFILPIWFSAIITRGLNVIYNLKQNYRKLIFISVLLWSYLLGKALSVVIDPVINNIFK